jgi:hypothetical protein
VEESKGEVIIEDEPQPEIKHIDLEVGAHPTEYEISGMDKTPSEQDSISSESKKETLNAGPATEGLPPVGLPEPSVQKGLEKDGLTASTQPSSDRIPTPGTITTVVKAPEEGTTDEPPAYRPGGFIGPPNTKIRDEQKYSDSAIRKRTKSTTTQPTKIIPQSPEQAQEGNFGVVTDHGKYYVAELTKNGLLTSMSVRADRMGRLTPSS